MRAVPRIIMMPLFLDHSPRPHRLMASRIVVGVTKGKGPEWPTLPLTKYFLLSTELTETSTCGAFRTCPRASMHFFCSSNGVNPEACTSPTSMSVIFPSGRTRTARLSSGSLQTRTSSTSPAPILYVFGSTAAATCGTGSGLASSGDWDCAGAPSGFAAGTCAPTGPASKEIASTQPEIRQLFQITRSIVSPPLAAERGKRTACLFRAMSQQPDSTQVFLVWYFSIYRPSHGAAGSCQQPIPA